ncbi:ABC transporter ATP-binding protein/permease [Isoptericola sp. NEAU-Y5]|uniref:ABC transporter ATP-binding protein/permease n=1 Tax=Isoptericola luteus TaxID=2879484 RepID=A0ABS7ZD69_9MICO|nr:ABC transporter ATP-binding protein [Isoptericola sp. NEAU-Y5]MCA5892873.1 ABC transporter ATP-binding protein/permease [Isoptericola sp. NEAU-Y5]
MAQHRTSEPVDRVDPSDPAVIARAARSQRKSLGRLRRLVVRSTSLVWQSGRGLFVAMVVLQLVAAAALAGQVLVVARLLDAIIALPGSGESFTTLVWPVAALAGLMALTSIITALQGMVRRLLGERVARVMTEEVQEVATGVPLHRFESPAFFDRLQRVKSNALSRPFQVTQGLFTFFGAVAAGIGVGASLVAIHPLLLPLLAVGAAPLLLTSRRESRLEFAFSLDQTPNQRERFYVNMVATGRDEAKEVRAFETAGWLYRRYRDLYDRYLVDLRAHLGRRARLTVLGQVVSGLTLTLTMLVLVWFIASGDVSVAGAGAAIVAIRMLQGQIQAMLGGVQQVFESGLYLDDVDAFMALGRSDRSQEGTGELPDRFEGVACDTVAFRYPGAERDALHDVSVRVGPGEVVALVGENGSGKTTAAKVLAGLYEASDGTVTWSGVDYRDVRPSDLRARIAVIFQDIVRYAFSARENIALGDADTAGGAGGAAQVDARVRRAAAAAGIDDALGGLAHGYDTRLSKLFAESSDLSGGQWQRIAIARAFYRDAALVILDEPSAALDPRAEHALFESLRSTLEGRAALFISHRFSTVRSADRIYVMAGGRVVESGTHDELMALGGEYAEMFTLQASAYLTSGQ